MAESPTPGQVAYEGAWRVHQELYPKAHRVPWRELHPSHKRGWEAAAQAVLALKPQAGLILSRAELEHLLNCLANQKFLHEMAEPLRGEAQTLIDMAWRQGMDWLAQGPQREPSALTCRWCGQAQAAHPQAGEPWRCRLSDGPLLPKERDHA